MSNYYWVTIGDWCRWTLEYRDEVEAWCQANGMKLAIDNSIASEYDEEKHLGSRNNTPRTYPNEWS